MHNRFSDVFWILEYARQDSIGRLHSWQYGGVARSQDEIDQMTQDIRSQFNCEVRAHRYSHALGSNA
jgi:hypothetical protein